MKMQPKLFFAIAVCFALTANAQKPFKEIGKDNEVDVLTLSNGRYVEHFTYDTLRQIGSVMFNTKTHKVKYFIAQDDTVRQHIIARAKEASRFMSVDPLARQFPFYSPYQFAGNNPISAIDLDGLESFVATKNYKSNAIALQLINAEDELSVIWSEKDKETKTEPLQISEVQKFVYNVNVNKKDGTITIPEGSSNTAQTFNYTKYQKDENGNFKKDETGRLIPYPGQEVNGNKELGLHIRAPFGINVQGGLLLSGENFKNNEDELLNNIWRGQEVKNNDYDQIDVFIKPNLRGKFLEIAKSWADVDLKKINFVDKPQQGNNEFELIYKKTSQNVEDIE